MVLDRIEQFSHFISRYFESVGTVAMIVMMVVTCIDVVGAKVFLRPLPGAFDFTILSQLVAIAFAAAFTLIKGMHVKVDFFVTRLSKGAQKFVGCIIHLLSWAFFVLILWRLSKYGYELQTSREVSSEIRIPLYPFAYLVAFASIPVCLILLVRILRSLTEVFKR